MAALDGAEPAMTSDMADAIGWRDEFLSANGPLFDEVEGIVSIRVVDVDVGERLRPVDLVWAAALGKLMARDGRCKRNRFACIRLHL